MPTGLTEKIGAWQSKGLSNEKVMPPTTSKIAFLQNGSEIIQK